MSELLIEQSEFAFVAETSKLDEATKSVNSKGLTVVRGIIATELNRKNANGRTYTTPKMRVSISECEKAGLFESKRLLCSADDHPKSTHVPPIQASHVVTRAYVESRGGKDYLMNDWMILPTDNGKNLKALIDAGVSVGTSIRGLGKVNESNNGEVEDYKYLGTDAVGNPSSGTYAHPSVYSVQTESVDVDLTIESIQSLVKDKQMTLDLKKAVSDFKSKYYSEGKTPDIKAHANAKEIVSEIITIELAAVKEGIELTSDFLDMKEEVLGQFSEAAPTVSPDNSKLMAESQDLVNKLQRKIGAEQAVSAFLTKQNAELSESIESMKSTITSYNEVIDSIKEELNDLLSGKDNDLDVMVLNKEQREEPV
jgi:hypothetical protein